MIYIEVAVNYPHYQRISLNHSKEFSRDVVTALKTLLSSGYIDDFLVLESAEPAPSVDESLTDQEIEALGKLLADSIMRTHRERVSGKGRKVKA